MFVDVRLKPEHDIEKAEHDYKEKEDEHDIEKAPQMRGWEISEAYFSAEANFFLSAEANILL